ncbi:PrgI family protein [Patescibacteria group bacterium]
MRFEVPQFIEVEDKIFGPLTIKQFIYLAGAGGLAFALFSFLPKFISFIFIIPVIGLGIALAFYKPNNRPFINTLEASFNYLKGGKLYVWKKEPKEIKKKKAEEIKDPASQLIIPKLSDSKLSDLSWSLDIKEKLEDEINKN